METGKTEPEMSDLEALANIQDELDNFSTMVTHAMITPDGTAVPIQINPETGEYMTVSGEPLIDPETQRQIFATSGDEEAIDTSDLSSLAAVAAAESAAETSVETTSATDQLEMEEQIVELGQVTSIGDLNEYSQQQEMEVETPRATSGNVGQAYQILSDGQQIQMLDNIEQPQQQIRIMSSDGSIQTLLPSTSNNPSFQVINSSNLIESPSSNIRIVNSDGTAVKNQSQIRIMNPDGTISQPAIKVQMPKTVIQQQPQIRILNADGTLSNLDSSNVQVITSTGVVKQQQPQIRVMRSQAGGSKTTLTLAQAQQMGLVTPASPTKTVIHKSPLKPIAAKPKSPIKQVVIKSAPGNNQSQQQIIRIPSSGASNSKVQYVRVVSGDNKPQQAQMVTVKSGTPILPSNVKTSGNVPIAIKPNTTTSNVVKIALPKQQKLTTTSQRVILPNTSVLSDVKPIFLPSTASSSTHTTTTTNIKNVLDTFSNRKDIVKPPSSSSPPTLDSPAPIAQSTSILEAAGVRPRKPCNCTKSQCLKLYCDCFANGEFCFNCNCTNCFNNLTHEEERQKSIKQCLERNSNAFRPKIGRNHNEHGERRHNKGCNCKRSGCLKNYCECYEAKIPCTDACRCIACKNIDEEDDGQGNAGASNAANANESTNESPAVPPRVPTPVIPVPVKVEMKPSLKSKLMPFSEASAFKPSNNKQQFSFVTNEVVGATCQCLLAQAEEAEKNKLAEPEIEGLILEEFGRCLKQIIEMSNKRNVE